jgi:hypothetical protein
MRKVLLRLGFKLLFGSAVVLSAVSCSKNDRIPLFPVQGKVLLDGKPLAHAFVVFRPVGEAGPQGLHPRAQADTDGIFVLSTYESEDGAPAGEYKVTVQKYKAPTDADNGPPVNLLPGRYAKPNSSRLTARVQEGQNDLPPLELKR